MHQRLARANEPFGRRRPAPIRLVRVSASKLGPREREGRIDRERLLQIADSPRRFVAGVAVDEVPRIQEAAM